jgi:predicted nucleic acid-binding Zn ribbon protein
MRHSLRSRVLEEWRGLPQPDGRADRTVTVGDALKQLAPKLGLANRLREQEVLNAWSAIVGEFFARHSHPAKLWEGTVIVHVVQPTILYELDRKWKPLVLRKLRERFGSRTIKDVRFRLG